MPASCSACTAWRSSAMPPGASRGSGAMKRHGIVAPAIGEAERRQMALVDPGGDRHQFDSVDAESAR